MDKIYMGYKKPVPENLTVVEIQRAVGGIEDGFPEELFETRYAIVDMDTGEIFDDAQGYGYRTKRKAYAALAYKRRPKEVFIKEAETKKKVHAFCRQHRKLIKRIREYMFMLARDGVPFTERDAENIISEEEKSTMEFTIADLIKYLD